MCNTHAPTSIFSKYSRNEVVLCFIVEFFLGKQCHKKIDASKKEQEGGFTSCKKLLLFCLLFLKKHRNNNT